MGAEFFKYYTPDMAAAITANGQAIIKKTAFEINKYINNEILKNDVHVDYQIAGDTDSVVGDTLIYVNGNKVKIEDYYNSISEFVKNDEKNQNFVKPVSCDTTKSLDSHNNIVDTSIKYVMKHKVKKNMYKITVDGKEVTVTEDHSIIVRRSGELLSLSVLDIQKRDKIIYISSGIIKEFHLFGIECLGEQELDVYDIETENHMFFGNDILVHNSVYFELVEIFNKYGDKSMSRTEKIEFMDKFCKQIESECLNPLYEKIHKELNCHKDNKALHMDREVICVGSEKTGYCGFWTGKKRYALMVDDNEGYRYDEPHLKIIGLSCVSAKTPEVVRADLKSCIVTLINDGIPEVRNFVKDTKEKFMLKSIDEISLSSSVSNVDKYVDKDTGLPNTGVWFDEDTGKNRNKGTPIYSTAAIYHNHLIDKFNLSKKYEKIRDKDKIKFVHLQQNPYGFHVMGYLNNLPEEFKLNDYVDYEAHFDKAFYSPVNDMLIACGSEIEEKISIDSFF